MSWKEHWNNAAKSSQDAIIQVRRKDLKSTLLTINHIENTLQINENDVVLDICCGNGLITSKISNICQEIHVVYISNELINIAKKSYQNKNIIYHCNTASELKNIFKNNMFDKVYLQFSFQYFDEKDQGEELITQVISLLKPNGLFFIGDIPQHEKWGAYYNTVLKKLFYLKWKIQKRKIMGKFWKSSELDKICEKLGVEGVYLKQKSELPYSYYRFDYIIKK